MSIYKVTVDTDLEDLIPTFLTNRAKDIARMKQSVVEENYEVIRIIGHSMKGFGAGYGFDYVTEVGAILESAAKENNRQLISKTIAQLEAYFENVKITYK